MEHIHLQVSTFDTSNVAVAHNLRSCSRPPSETKTKTKTSRVETKTKTKTSKSGLDRSRDQDQVSRPTSLAQPLKHPQYESVRNEGITETDHPGQNEVVYLLCRSVTPVNMTPSHVRSPFVFVLLVL